MEPTKKKITKPVRPDNDDCCGGGGCCPCVWDTYFNALDEWEAQEAEAQKVKEDDQ